MHIDTARNLRAQLDIAIGKAEANGDTEIVLASFAAADDDKARAELDAAIASAVDKK